MTGINFPKGKFYDFLKNHARICDCNCTKYNNTIEKMLTIGFTEEDLLNCDERTITDKYIGMSHDGKPMSKQTHLDYRTAIRKYREFLEVTT